MISHNVSRAFIIAALSLTVGPAFAQTTTRVGVPVKGDKVYKQTFTKKVAEALGERIRVAKFIDIDVSQKSTTILEVRHENPLSSLEKILLTAPGRFEVREIANDSALFDVALAEFSALAARRDGGVRSICATKRRTLDDALARMVGPDVNFAVFRHDGVNAWCAVALRSKVLGNKAVTSISYKKSISGQRTLSIKIDPNHLARLAENGELVVKMLGITIDGDLIARSTLGQMERQPISVTPPSFITDDALRKRWLSMIHALIDAKIPVPLVLLEDV